MHECGIKPCIHLILEGEDGGYVKDDFMVMEGDILVTYNCEIIKSHVKRNLEGYLRYLLPKGKVKGHEYAVGNVQGDKGESLRIELRGDKTGLWIDHATDESGDMITLWELVKGVDFQTALQQIVRWLGLPEAVALDEPKKITTQSWIYTDIQGNPLVQITRRDSDTGKSYSVYDVVRQLHKAPDTRPLYNLHKLPETDHIYFVEGEKAAAALIQKGYIATTVMGGANAPLDKTDWSVLKNKKITIWPDHDKPGRDFAKRVAEKLESLGVMNVQTLQIPEHYPKGFDAADVLDIDGFLKTTSEILDNDVPLIHNWHCTKYSPPANKLLYLVDGIFPLGCTSIVAAAGATGKGLLLLDLALKVAAKKNQHCAFGEKVLQHGAAVIFAAEDDFLTIHNRLEAIDLNRVRDEQNLNLYFVPLPNDKGAFPIAQSHKKILK